MTPRVRESIEAASPQAVGQLADLASRLAAQLRDCADTQNRDHDAYDFAAHTNPATTHKHYDRRVVKKASATE